MKFRIVQAVEYLCEETCIVVFWLGIWSVFTNFTHLLHSLVFVLFLLFGGAGGLFLLKAIVPSMIRQVAHETSHAFSEVIPGSTQINTFVRTKGRLAQIRSTQTEERRRHARK